MEAGNSDKRKEVRQTMIKGGSGRKYKKREEIEAPMSGSARVVKAKEEGDGRQSGMKERNKEKMQ